MVGQERGMAALKTTLLFGMWSLIPYGSYLLAVYLLLDHCGLRGALLGAVMIWMLAAALLIFLWTKFA